MTNSSSQTRIVNPSHPYKGLTFVRQAAADPQTGRREINYFDIAGDSFTDGCIEGCKALLEVLAQIRTGNVPLREILRAVGSIDPDENNDVEMGAAIGFTEALEHLLRQVVTPNVLASFASEQLAQHTKSVEDDLASLKARNVQFLAAL
jgi:hypothetical protein